MIKDNVQQLLRELPADVELVAAAKGRTLQEIQQAIAAGVRIVGENYVQEAEQAFGIIGHQVRWHFIGHLQKNKIKKAVKLFDLIETIDSVEVAQGLECVCAAENKVMPVLVEINSGRERQKFGVMPEEAEGLLKRLSGLTHIRVMGLMTMGPQSGRPEEARPYFLQTKRVFERIKSLHIDGVEMRYLSMGMSNTYRVAIAEGANIVRIGSKIFGERN